MAMLSAAFAMIGAIWQASPTGGAIGFATLIAYCLFWIALPWTARTINQAGQFIRRIANSAWTEFIGSRDGRH